MIFVALHNRGIFNFFSTIFSCQSSLTVPLKGQWSCAVDQAENDMMQKSK